MPLTPDADLVMLRPAVTFIVALEPAQNGINSLLLLNSIERRSGLGEWVRRTAASLPPEVLRRNQLVIEGLPYAVAPARRFPSFLAYVDDLAAQDAFPLRDRLLLGLCRPHGDVPARLTARGLLADPA